MDYILRRECAISQIDDLEPLYAFKDFPVFMGCSLNHFEQDLKADMSWVISKNSGLIQLKYLLPLDVLYPESHGAGCVGDLWRQHHVAFAKFIHKIEPEKVFEIGGSHGILAKEYDSLAEVSWTILEPNPTPIDGSKALFIKGFFDDNFKYSLQFDAVIHSHVFEHIYEPNKFMKQLSNFIPNGKRMIFSIPNMQIMLDRNYTNCINFEHTIFLTEPYVNYLLSKHGFRILHKEYFKDDHSIFYAVVKEDTLEVAGLADNLYLKNKKTYLDYIDYHEKLILNLNHKMNSTHQPIYLFGAHVFAQYLLAFGLNKNKIVSLLDNDINKQGKRLYGTSLLVESPKILHSIENPIVILKAGVYNEEVKSDILNNINPNVVFWE